jgi:tellurite resistance protein
MVITAAYQIAAADGQVDDSEHQLLLQFAEQMNFRPAHFCLG